jgi:glycine oxidase
LVSVSSRVAVIGAGIIGSAVAFELAGRGAQVTIYDRRRVGGGATHASAGILAPFIEAHEGGALLDLTSASLQLFPAFVREVRRQSTVPFEFALCGTFEIAETAARSLALRERLAMRSIADVRLEWLDAVRVRALEPSINPTVQGALLCQQHGFVAVEAFTDALVDAAISLGAVFRTADVQGIDVSTRGVAIRVDGGSELATHVVVCAGAWAEAIDPCGELHHRTKPIRGQLLRLRSADVRCEHILWGDGCYIVPWANGRLLIGATSEDVGFDERPTAHGVHSLLQAACDMVPALREAEFEGVRVGLRPATTDGLPILGPSRSDPRVIYATGHFRNGVLLSPLTATIIADYVMTETTSPFMTTVVKNEA